MRIHFFPNPNETTFIVHLPSTIYIPLASPERETRQEGALSQPPPWSQHRPLQGQERPRRRGHQRAQPQARHQ